MPAVANDVDDDYCNHYNDNDDGYEDDDDDDDDDYDDDDRVHKTYPEREREAKNTKKERIQTY